MSKRRGPAPRKQVTPKKPAAKPLDSDDVARAQDSSLGDQIDEPSPDTADGRGKHTDAAGEPSDAVATHPDAGSDSADTADGTADEAAPLPPIDLIHAEPEPIDETYLRDLMRAWRRGRATRRLGQVLQDGYVAVFAVVMIVAMLGGAIYQVQGAAAGCVSATCTVGRTLLPWVAIGAAFCLTLLASRIFGPVVASAAEGFWLMDAPIRRSRFLWRRFVAALVGVLFGMALLGALLAAITGYPWQQILQWASALGLGSAGLTALAATEQTYGRTWIVKLFQWIFGAAALAALFAITGVAAGWFQLSMLTNVNTEIVLIVAAVGLVLLVVFVAVSLTRLGYIHRARLVSGGNLVSGMQGAMFAMDFGLMRDILVERDMAVLGHVRATRGRGVGAQALVWRELQRLLRFPKRLLLLVVSGVVPYAVSSLGLHTFAPLVSSLILLVGFVPMFSTMRVLTRTKGLARTFPLSNPQIRGAVAVIPALLGVVWAVAATPAFYGIGVATPYMSLTSAFVTALLTGAAGVLAAIRWVSAKSANYSSPMMQTGFGALPPGLLFNLFRGLDICFLVTGPMLLGWSLWISVILAVVAGFALSGRFDMQEMQQMQKEMEKERAAIKKQGGGTGIGATLSAAMAQTDKRYANEKIKIAPPKR